MAKYSSFQYGDGTKYGSSAETAGGVFLWAINFDWNGDGEYDGENEAAYMRGVPEISLGSEFYLEQNGGGFAKLPPATCTIYFHNKDRRYDPRNASSPLYPNIVPGRLVKVMVRDLAGSVTYTLFTGKIDNIIPLTAPGGGEVRFELRGFSQQLMDYQLTSSTGLINTDIATAIEQVLLDADYPGAIDIEADAQPVHSFGVKNKGALETVFSLAHAALGVFFVSKDGTAKFYARSHSYPAATSLNQSQCLNRPAITQPWDGVYNRVEVYCSRQIKEQPSIIYFLAGPEEIAQSTDEYIYFDYPPASDVVVSTYEANTAEDGTGTDITSTTTVTPTLNYANGEALVRNNSHSGYMIKLEVRGRALRAVEELHYDTDATSQATYGRRVFILDSEFLQDQNYAESFKATLLAFLKDDRESLVLQIENRPTLQFAIDLFTPIEFTSTTLDLSAVTYYVTGIKHSGAKRETSHGVVTTLYLHKIITDSTSITPAPVQEEQQQAPLGYGDPSGDPETLEAVENSDSALGDIELCYVEKLAIANNGAANFLDEVLTGFTALIDTDDMYVNATNYIELNTGIYEIYCEVEWAPVATDNEEHGISVFLFDEDWILSQTLRGGSGQTLMYSSRPASSNTAVCSAIISTQYIKYIMFGGWIDNATLYAAIGSDIKINKFHFWARRLTKKVLDITVPQ